ncbi:magnesium protoporphyrin chelatase [Rubinisphaera brasiliensis]|uniref:Magnesium protoporphyrin chelatase, putative n=1 Tax=Rubinisphaera brasiliensis (strain ATCC 49424 / DSM 5305 / JCM 21570 / IAM 15109 / NBRC 103401 / IFAM 1448) TaxID=756272 RepID=F0SH29_RUBBR|nr:magnesium protoporphyrin chelatase [Rubinisphaera brasiliensis]ADY59514.1 magnesium protoporphyrin chelatase, putative [Rubinisphaera brasiliensis DSM 5305]
MEYPTTLRELQESGWQSKTVKQEIRDNFLAALGRDDELFPGVIGYEDTVIPEISIALLAGHDMLFLGEKGQAKSRIMRSLVRFLDPAIPYLDGPNIPVHEDPYHPISAAGKKYLAENSPDDVKIAWWPREERYAERLAPGTKFADVIGEIDPAKLIGGVSMSTEDALHFGLIPRMHRGLFAMNELPELDELVQVGLFNILEERDVQIRGYPIRFDLDLMILFSANPATYNRSGKVIPQLKDRIGALIQTHYPRDRDMGIQMVEQEAGIDLDGEYPVAIPYFMREILEQITVQARRSKFVDHDSGVSARFSIANYRTMVASARRRAVMLNEKPAVPRISDLGHLYASSLGKLELDLMGSHQMSEKQVLDAVIAEAVRTVFEEYVEGHSLAEIGEIFAKGVKIEVGDLLPSSHYAERLQRVPPVWERAFEVNAAEDPAMRASCVEFVLAGLYAMDQISRSQHHGRITYEFE